MQEELVQRCKEYALHLAGTANVPIGVWDTQAGTPLYSTASPRFCEGCTCPRCSEANTQLYGCNEAYRWNGEYIYYCPLGLVFAASSISEDTGSIAGGLVAGPLIMGDAQDALADLDEETRRRAAGLPGAAAGAGQPSCGHPLRHRSLRERYAPQQGGRVCLRAGQDAQRDLRRPGQYAGRG